MSKADNIKRAKILRQRKKEREKQTIMNGQLWKDQQVLREKAEKENMKVVDRSLFGRKEKISSILLEMIKPVLFTAQDEEDARGIVSMGVVAWNCGIIKQTMGDKKLKEAMKFFKANENSEEKKLLDRYIELKCNKYHQYTDLITDFQVSFERDGRMNFSVMTCVNK